MSNFKNISTKVSAECWQQFNDLCAVRNLTPYELVQMVVDTLVRYMDGSHQLGPEMETLIHTFESLQGWKDAFNIADPTARPEVSEATYYLRDGSGKNSGCRAVLVSTPFMGQGEYTYNVQTICERMFCLVFPQLYRRLRMVGVGRGTNSVIETVESMVQDWLDGEDDRELAKMFSDNQRGENARDPHEGEPFVRKKVVDMERMFGDENIVLDNRCAQDEKGEEADDED